MGRNKKASGAKRPKLVDIRPDEAIKAFAKIGFVGDRQRGSHIALVKPGHPYTLVIPAHDVVAVGTLKQCITSAGITVEEFVKLLG